MNEVFCKLKNKNKKYINIKKVKFEYFLFLFCCRNKKNQVTEHNKKHSKKKKFKCFKEKVKIPESWKLELSQLKGMYNLENIF